jgi:hypothetical protein
MTNATSGALSSAAVAKITKDVGELHARTAQILIDKDAQGVQEHFSPLFSTTGGDFNFASRDEIINGLKNGEHKYSRIHNTVSDIHVPNHSTAIVVGTRHVDGTVNGERFEANFPLKAVYTLHDDKWTVLLWAVSRPE